MDGGIEKSLKLKSWGVTVNRGLVKYSRNTAPYILANILKLFPSSSLNSTIIGMIIAILSILFKAISLFMCSSSNTSFKSGLDDAILDQN